MFTDPSLLGKINASVELHELDMNELNRLAARLEWLKSARPDQLPPEDYDTWILLGGRGSGKTRAGAEDIAWNCLISPTRAAVVAPTNNDVRKTCFEGESGLLSVLPRGSILNYNRSSLEMWLKGGSYIVGYSSEEPERLRGPQHHIAWCDELATWRYLQETWDMLQFGLRLGDDPRVTVTTTPKSIRFLQDLLAEQGSVISTATTYDNLDNLPEKFIKRVKERYEGTRLGKQELLAQLLMDNPNAIFFDANIHKNRITSRDFEDIEIGRTVVAVDPPIEMNVNSDECGIVAVSADQRSGTSSHFYVREDHTVQGVSPTAWGTRAVDLYHSLEADLIIAETNNGGALVETVIRSIDPNVNYRAVKATRGKWLRAEPIAALYEQNRVHHVGNFGMLETQMVDFTPTGLSGDNKKSPDRLDALVWALTELSGRRSGDPRVRSL